MRVTRGAALARAFVSRPAALALLALLLALPAAAADEEPPVVAVNYAPPTPQANESFAITITFAENFTANETEFLICSFSKGICAQPVAGEARGNNTYNATVTIISDPGDRLGFKFKVVDDNDTVYRYPTADTDAPDHEIDTLNGDHYFVVQVQGGDEPKPKEGIPAVGLPLLLGAAAVAARRRRAR